MKKDKPNGVCRFFAAWYRQIVSDKASFFVFAVLNAVTIGVGMYGVVMGQYGCLLLCLWTLLLSFVPSLIATVFRLSVPTGLAVLTFVFIFCAQILGSAFHFYTRLPFWDSVLHTFSGFMFAAVGCCLIDLIHRDPSVKFRLSPFFVALVAVCFAVMIGIFWEFFEFSADHLIGTDMQKDFIVSSFSSVTFDPNGLNIPVPVRSIVETVITTESGEVFTVNGYLDIGVIDTIKDLFLDFLGAVIFGVFGFLYIKRQGKGKFAASFIPTLSNRE